MNRILVSCGVLVLCAGVGLAFPDNQEAPRATLPLTLPQAIRLALERAPELAIATAQSARAGEAVRETRSLNLPQVVTGTGLAYNNGFPLSIEGSAPSIVQVGVSQAFLSKKNNNLIREAAQSHQASRAGMNVARDELIARTAMLYHSLHQARKITALWMVRLESAQKDQQIVETLLEAGKARPVDVTAARMVTANARQQRLVASEESLLAESELKAIIGFTRDDALQTDDPSLEAAALETSPDVLYQGALENHDQIRQAEATLRAREFHVEAEKGEYFPRLDLVSQYALFSRTNNYQDYFNRFTRNNFLVGLSIQVPLFNGYRTGARVAQSQQELAESRLRLQRLKSEIKLGIERSASQLRIARSALELSRQDVAAARENLEINQVLFESGRIGARELETVRGLLQEKEILVVEAEKLLFRRKLELLLVTGTLGDAFNS